MKDMSVEELIDVYTYPHTHSFKQVIGSRYELLRRFEALEKEVEKHKRTAICMYCGTVQQTKDGQEKLAMIIEHMAVCEKHPVPKLLMEIEDLKCCANCESEDDGCDFWMSLCDTNSCCPKWQSDGLTREDREGVIQICIVT